LGTEQLRNGLIAGLIGFGLIILYLAWQYRGLAVVAVASLVFLVVVHKLEYFLNFPNLTLVYIPQLNAKYYANERQLVTTSMSLLSYPLINSIDFGVFAEKSFNIVGKNNFYETSKNTVMSVIDSGYTVFAKRPLYSKKLLNKKK